MTDEEFKPILEQLITDMEKELEGVVPFDDFDEEAIRKEFEVPDCGSDFELSGTAFPLINNRNNEG